jgi:DNA polymerase-3 subunit epsilon
MRWAAFDFETATHARDSACAVGVVVVEDGEVVESDSWLIRPPGNFYFGRNIAVHGITPEETEDAARFDEVWWEVEQMIGDRPLVAHNASFDLSVLQNCAELYGMGLAERHVWCTMRLSKKVWPDLGRWNLPSVAYQVGFELNHHEALSDAAACSDVVSRCIFDSDANGLAHLGELVGVDPRSTTTRPRVSR